MKAGDLVRKRANIWANVRHGILMAYWLLVSLDHPRL